MKNRPPNGDRLFMAGSTGIEPAISSVTGRRDNHFTTSPRRNLVNALLVSEIASGKVHLGGSKLPRNRGNDSKSYQEMQRLNRDKAAGF